jgi:hypothetical protein
VIFLSGKAEVMTDFEKDIIEELKKKYCHYGLYRPNDLPVLRRTIRQKYRNAETVIAKLDKTLDKILALVELAAELAAKGIARDSLELNDLKPQMKNLAGPEFCGALYQKYDSCIAPKPFKQISADMEAEAKQVRRKQDVHTKEWQPGFPGNITMPRHRRFPAPGSWMACHRVPGCRRLCRFFVVFP